MLLEDGHSLVLVDTGIGLLDVRQPQERIGQALIDLAGFQFDESITAVRQVERLGFRNSDVTDVVLTHCDPDHAGGLADFPAATVHVAEEELANLMRGSWRYLPVQFTHRPNWSPTSRSDRNWYGLEARPLNMQLESEVLLIPLFGHTHGHCGVAVRGIGRWVLHVGDAYYLRAELETDDHWVSQLVAQRADDDVRRRESLEHLRRLARNHAHEIDTFSYHDPSEFH